MPAKSLMVQAKQVIDPVIENQRVQASRVCERPASALPGLIGLAPPPCLASAGTRPAGLGNPRGLPPLGVLRLTHEADFDPRGTELAERLRVWGQGVGGVGKPANDTGSGARA
jgi:hypothetical protein